MLMDFSPLDYPEIETRKPYYLKDGEVMIQKPYMKGGNRIVCSALRFSDGFVVASVRHMDPIDHQFLKRYPEYIGVEYEQGFIDRNYKYHDRHSAWKIAFDAGQIINRCGGDMSAEGVGKLWSENLY